MKHYLVVLVILFFLTQAFAQQGIGNLSNTSKKKKQIKTTVIQIDLSSPTEHSLLNKSNRKRLVFDSRSPLAVALINGNPFRYKYTLNYDKVDLFGTSDFSIEGNGTD